MFPSRGRVNIHTLSASIPATANTPPCHARPPLTRSRRLTFSCRKLHRFPHIPRISVSIFPFLFFLPFSPSQMNLPTTTPVVVAGAFFFFFFFAHSQLLRACAPRRVFAYQGPHELAVLSAAEGTRARNERKPKTAALVILSHQPSGSTPLLHHHTLIILFLV